MALPVIQIMNQLQRGVREEIDDISDEETMADEEDGDIEVQAEEEEEVGENFQDTELELLDGDREGTKWLVINGVHIYAKDKGQRKQLPGNVLEGEDWAVNLRYGQQIQRALCSLNHHDE